MSAPTLLVHLKFDEADGSTSTTDSSSNAWTVTRRGSVVIDTAQKASGTASSYFPADGGSGTSAGTHGWSLPPGVNVSGLTNFIIQFDVRWENDNNGESYFYYKNQNATSYVALLYDNAGTRWRFLHQAGVGTDIAMNFSSWTPVVGTWYRVKFEKSGTSFTLRVNGTQIGSTVVSAVAIPNLNTTNVLINDNAGGTPNRAFQGWLDNYIISPDTFTTLVDTALHAPINGASFCPYVVQGQARKMVTTISGLDHLEGEEVQAQADGLPVMDGDEPKLFTVTSGDITLPERAAVVHAGLPYDGKAKLLKPSEGQTRMRRMYMTKVRIYRSLNFKVGLDEDHLDSVIFEGRNSAEPALPLISGDVEKLPNTTWGREQQMMIVQDIPAPLFILMILIQSEVEERQ